MRKTLVISLCAGVLAAGAFAQSKKPEPAPKDNSTLPVIAGDKLAKIEAALPAKASASPKKPRKLLVFWRCEQFFHAGGIDLSDAATDAGGKRKARKDNDYAVAWVRAEGAGRAEEVKVQTGSVMTSMSGVAYCVFLLMSLPGAPRVLAGEDAPATPAWVADEAPVYVDPEDDWAKDPSVIKAGDTWYMYYTSANCWQDGGCGGKGAARIDYATSPDGLRWTHQGVSIPKGKPGEWDEERPQAPARPVLKDGVYYLYYAGRATAKGAAVAIGYATSTDLRHWVKHPGNPVLSKGKCNDPFIWFERGVYTLFYTTGGDSIRYVTSTNLTDWSAQSVDTGAVGEGSVVIKDGPRYTLFGCVGFSNSGEYYKAYAAGDLAKPFKDCGRIKLNTPEFAKGSLSHGDILRQGGEYWFYFQGTRDGGKRFQIGLARRQDL